MSRLPPPRQTRLTSTALNIEMLPQLSRLLALRTRLPSEYQLPNLFLYRHRHEYELRADAGGMSINGVTYDGERHALPLGPLTPDRAQRLLEKVDCIYPLEEQEAADLCASAALTMDYNRADSDYLYQAGNLGPLANAKKKRSQARSFDLACNPRIERVDETNLEYAHTVLDGWLNDVARPKQATDFAECIEALVWRDELKLCAMVIIADDMPAGLLIAGHAHENERVIHFAKGRRRYAGVYPWMFSRFAQQADVELINFEQDLGNPGLAQSKQAFAPLGLRHKFRVRAA